MLIPEHKIEEVLARVDLVALVSRHVELKKSGRSFKGRCPFHQDKSPSFYVTPEIGRFKCFGCDAGGDAIAFVQRYLGKSFVDSVRDLAREAGVDLESGQDPSAVERQQLKEVTDVAFEHFKAALWDETEGRLARAYLVERGVSLEAAKTFGLGWARAEWDDLAKKLMARGILEFGTRAGLVTPRSRGDGYYDTFRGRLIIPIRSPEGRCIAFGGRLLVGDEGPKYLNSRESKLYNKSETLYGMDQARDEIRHAKAAVLVEGYFDCIGLHQVGVRHAVALCSTALTPGHVSLLTRMEAKELVLLLDGDEAGRKAVERLAVNLLANGTPTRVALLPTGEDPDTFARREGVEGVRQLLAGAAPLSRHLFLSVLPRGVEATFEEKMEALQRLRPVAVGLPVGLYRSAFFAALSQHSGLPAAELEASLRGKAPSPLQPAPKPAPAVARKPEKPAEPLEAYFVAALLRQPRLQGLDTQRAGDELKHTGLRSLVAGLSSGSQPSDVLEEASEGLRKTLEASSRQLPSDPAALEEAFRTVCHRLKLGRIDDRLRDIARLTAQVASAHELTEETKKLQEERVELLGLRRKVMEAASSSAPGTKPAGHSV